MAFVRYEVRAGTTIAVFRLASPQLEWGPGGEDTWVSETVFDYRSLQERLRNLQRRGDPAPATAAALAGWPSQGAEENLPVWPADDPVPVQSKAAAVMRLLRGERPDTVAQSIGIPVATLLAWQEAFLTAGTATLDC
jgi:hypothetical protein